jgi:hypothetical protein
MSGARYLIGLTCSGYQGLRDPSKSLIPPAEAWIRTQSSPPHPTLTPEIASIIHARAVVFAARRGGQIYRVVAGQTYCWISVGNLNCFGNIYAMPQSVRLTSTFIAVRRGLWTKDRRMLSRRRAIVASRDRVGAAFDGAIAEAIRWSFYNA